MFCGRNDESESSDSLIVRHMHRSITAIRQIWINVEDSLEVEIPCVQICEPHDTRITDFIS